MEPTHIFLDHTADVFFVAKAPTLEQLFDQCGLAVEETMIDLPSVKPKQKIKILVEADKIETLLFDFLDELVFFKDYKQLVFSKFEIKIEEQGKKFSLSCFAHGEKLDVLRHKPKVDVKAITMHMFEVKQVPGGWKAQVLVDI